MASRPGVLVTRPQEQSADLCAAVAAAGFSVHARPLLELEGLTELAPAQRQLLQELDLYRHIIFVSANAVRFGMSWVEDYWPRLPVGPAWYAIGDATAKILRRYGIEAITPGGTMTSEALLAMPQLLAVEGQRVLIIKGQGGRSALREALGQRGARVEELACYRRHCPALEPGELAATLARWDIGLVMISSGEGLANLRTLLSPQETIKLMPITLLVPSDRIATMAHEAGFEQVITAENASDDAMLRALEEWQPSPGE